MVGQESQAGTRRWGLAAILNDVVTQATEGRRALRSVVLDPKEPPKN